MKILIRLTLILAAMIAFLTAMIVTHAQHRANGREVVLNIEPFDPRDLLLGYYSRIRTDAHALDTSDLDGPRTGWAQGDRAFVRLEPQDDGSWQPVSVLREHPGDGVYLQGRIRSASTRYDWQDAQGRRSDRYEAGAEPVPGSEHQRLFLAYNLEAYYAEADAARELDELREDNQLRLIVALSEDGRAVIKGLEINGERRVDSLFGTDR